MSCPNKDFSEANNWSSKNYFHIPLKGNGVEVFFVSRSFTFDLLELLETGDLTPFTTVYVFIARSNKKCFLSISFVV